MCTPLRSAFLRFRNISTCVIAVVVTLPLWWLWWLLRRVGLAYHSLLWHRHITLASVRRATHDHHDHHDHHFPRARGRRRGKGDACLCWRISHHIGSGTLCWVDPRVLGRSRIFCPFGCPLLVETGSGGRCVWIRHGCDST